MTVESGKSVRAVPTHMEDGSLDRPEPPRLWMLSEGSRHRDRMFAADLRVISESFSSDSNSDVVDGLTRLSTRETRIRCGCERASKNSQNPGIMI